MNFFEKNRGLKFKGNQFAEFLRFLCLTFSIQNLVYGAEGTASFQIDARTSVGIQSPFPLESKGDSLEQFSPGYLSFRVPNPNFDLWEETPPLLHLNLTYQPSPKILFSTSAALRRDFQAWSREKDHGNIPLAPMEVDLNQPYSGSFSYIDNNFRTSLFRLPQHWSPSSEMGLTLTKQAGPLDGISFRIGPEKIHYTWMLSSLNPWLEGTPVSNGGPYPEQSEERRQARVDEGDYNAHKRTYTDKYKTLLAHRFQLTLGQVVIGMTEINMIGGKLPSLRDMSPFTSFHNNFNDGFSNNGLSFELSASVKENTRIFSELFMDDINFSSTESDSKVPTSLGWMLGLDNKTHFSNWSFEQTVHFVHTDPYLYNHWRPLTTFYSRRIFTSNYQNEGEFPFVDQIVADRPLGYFRGPGADDLWFKGTLKNAKGWGIMIHLGRLSQGAKDLRTPYESVQIDATDGPLPREKELRGEIRFEAEKWPFTQGFMTNSFWSVNLLTRQVENLNHQAGKNESGWALGMNVGWRLSWEPGE